MSETWYYGDVYSDKIVPFIVEKSTDHTVWTKSRWPVSVSNTETKSNKLIRHKITDDGIFIRRTKKEVLDCLIIELDHRIMKYRIKIDAMIGQKNLLKSSEKDIE